MRHLSTEIFYGMKYCPTIQKEDVVLYCMITNENVFSERSQTPHIHTCTQTRACLIGKLFLYAFN